MLLPIVAYGDPVLKKIAENIAPDYPNLPKIIADMYQTMANAHGVGLAAPQVGLAIRLFVIDAEPFDESLAGYKKTFINAEIIDESDNETDFNEGCLSIPEVRGIVKRPEKILMRYVDENFVPHEAWFEGMPARIIQHEYDHIEGILFTDYFTPLKRRLLQKQFSNISAGKIDVEYKMRFPNKSKIR
jgi:peptide deformylase